MSTGGDASFVRRSFRRVSARIRPKHLDRKKLGVLGAPVCRCTPLVLALCVALTGLVVVGVGSCMSAFMWHDDKARGLGLALVGLGVTMLIAGSGLFIYDHYFRPIMPPRETGVAYQHGNHQVSPELLTASSLGADRAAIAVTNVQTVRTNNGQSRNVPPKHISAPPAYDSICNDDSRPRSSLQSHEHDQKPPGGRGPASSSGVRGSHEQQTSVGRGSHHSALRETTTTSTVV